MARSLHRDALKARRAARRKATAHQTKTAARKIDTYDIESMVIIGGNGLRYVF